MNTQPVYPLSRRRFLQDLGLLGLLLSGCTVPGAPGTTATPPGRTPGSTPGGTPGGGRPSDPRLATAHEQVDPRLVAANTRFGFKLFRELARADAGHNLLISPASVALALAMTYNGAAGETRAAMARALEVAELSRDELNAAYDVLLLTLQTPSPDARLEIANSLWARQDIAFKQDFLERVRTYYAAEVNNLDFDDPAAAEAINKWVREQTEGRIEKIVERIQPEDILFLINALYFKAPWSEPFDPGNTEDGDFTLADGSTRRVPFMRHTLDHTVYLSGDGFKAVRLPYGGPPEGTPPADLPPFLPDRLSMFVFVPDAGRSLDELLGRLDADSWGRWLKAFQPQAVKLRLPRFQYDYQAELKTALSALGMGVAFDPGQAELGDLVSLPGGINAYVSGVLHKTFIAVDEEGTEAAAVTAVKVGITSAPAEPVELSVDRPFFYAIADTVTGSILFLGAVVEP